MEGGVLEFDFEELSSEEKMLSGTAEEDVEDVAEEAETASEVTVSMAETSDIAAKSGFKSIILFFFAGSAVSTSPFSGESSTRITEVSMAVVMVTGTSTAGSASVLMVAWKDVSSPDEESTKTQLSSLSTPLLEVSDISMG